MITEADARMRTVIEACSFGIRRALRAGSMPIDVIGGLANLLVEHALLHGVSLETLKDCVDRVYAHQLAHKASLKRTRPTKRVRR